MDRLPIGWRALAGRETTARRRELIDDLRLLDRVRPVTTPAGDAYPAEPARRASTVATALVLALAGLQTVGCLAVAAGAAISGHPVVLASRLVLAVGFSGGALVVAAAAGRDRRTLGLIAVLSCVASAFARGSTFGLLAPSTHLQALLHGVLPIAFAPAALWQFALAFPRVDRFTTFDVAARRAMGGAWVLGGVLFVATLGAGPGTTRVAPIVGWNGPAYMFWHLFVIALLPAIVVLAVRSRRAPPAERRRIVRFAATLAIGSGPLLVFGALRLAIPGLDHWFVASGAAGHIWIDRAVLWPLAATPVLSSAVLLLDRPFESQSAPGLPSPGRLARAAFWLCLVTPLVTSAVLLYRLRRVPIADLPAIGGWVLMMATSAAIVVLVIAWRRGAGAVVLLANDRRRVSLALQRVRNPRGGRELAALLAAEIADGTQATFGRALFRTADGSFVDPSGETGPLASSTALSAVLLRTSGTIDLTDRALGTLLPAADRMWVETNGIGMAAALRDRAGIPIAVLAFGESRVGAFSRRDRWLTATLIDAASGIGNDDGPPRRRGAVRRRRREPAFECGTCGAVARSLSASCGCQRGLVLSALPLRLGDSLAIERRLGAGGMGVVYRGCDLRLHRQVALKTVPALRGEAAARLRCEARAMAALNHDALATLYGLEFWRGTPVLVEEYLPGGTLAARLAGGPLPASEAAAVVWRITDAVAYMHRRGVLHGDVKPGNIAFTAIGSAKLLDFGLSTLIGSAALAGAGTPDYLPPECGDRTVVDPSLDLWALSVTFLEAIGGADARGAARSPRALATILDRPAFARHAGLRAFFERALGPDPSSRFITAIEMRNAVQRLLSPSSRPLG